MPTYTVTLSVTVTETYEVEAPSRVEADSKARDCFIMRDWNEYLPFNDEIETHNIVKQD